MPKLKEKVVCDSLFDPHAGNFNSSRTSNTYSSIGTPGQAYVPEGRMKAYKLPSRMGDQLHYPDGTITETSHGRKESLN